jgi:hypothetical protein
MSSTPQMQETVNPKTGMTHTEATEFVRNHFEEFVYRKNLKIGEVNFAPEFVDHGADVPPGLPPGPARSRMSAERTRNFPTFTWTYWT